MKNHTELLNNLAEKYNLKSYLEIGVQNMENNFNKINCLIKYGCDPDPKLSGKIDIYAGNSDQMFYGWTKKFDLIFIDGLHHADQVKRDFENSLNCLNDGGYIVLHDTLPDQEKYTSVPRATNIWYGDVFKFAMTLGQYQGIGFVTLNMDCGCTVVWKEPGKEKQPPLASKMDWQTYKQIGKVLLNVIEPEEFKNLSMNV